MQIECKGNPSLWFSKMCVFQTAHYKIFIIITQVHENFIPDKFHRAVKNNNYFQMNPKAPSDR